MPMNPRSASPKAPKAVRRTAAITTARSAMARRWAAVIPLVRATNRGASPGGSITTKRVTKAVMAAAISMACPG